MTQQQTIIVAVAIVIAFVAVILATCRSGPRVTHIETRRDDETNV